jgi:hypothetical protein
MRRGIADARKRVSPRIVGQGADDARSGRLQVNVIKLSGAGSSRSAWEPLLDAPRPSEQRTQSVRRGVPRAAWNEQNPLT